MMTCESLRDKLNAFDPAVRRDALATLAAAGFAGVPATRNVNLHFHSFFSFNALGWSPARIAFEARAAGLYAAGLCDFDVLDGREEFIRAGELLGLRVTVNVETRTFVPERSDLEIDSPGEPGVSYCMGAGFAFDPPAGSAPAVTLALYRQTARERNLALVSRINTGIPDIAVEYDRDVLPLSPAGTATERHIVEAYLARARAVFPDAAARAAFWASILAKPATELHALFSDPAALSELVRARLVKRGGLGYEQPTAKTFPPVKEFFAWVRACGAVPMESWLDGSSAGEADSRALLECAQANGALALNIIPDRNWNIKDPATKKRRLVKLAEIVALAEQLGLPVNIGTEMNKPGQPLTDLLDGAALKPFAAVFMKGAQIMVGHTVLLRHAGFSYAGAPAEAEFAGKVAGKNAFFAQVGALPPVTSALAERLRTAGPERAYAVIRDAVTAGAWPALPY